MSTYDIQKIMQYLPHRYPFLLIDRVNEVVPGEKVIALKNVTINEPRTLYFVVKQPESPPAITSAASKSVRSWPLA